MLYAIDSMPHTIDQKPVDLPLLNEYSPEEVTKEYYSFEEVTQPSTQLTKKRRLVTYSRKPVYKRRRRVVCLILVLLVPLVLGGSLLVHNVGRTDSEPLEQVVAPTGVQRPEVIVESLNDEEEVLYEEAEREAAAPDDPTLYLTVPRLGIYDHTVRNDRSEEALDLGAIKLPYTGFPWQKEDTNTYIACHRLGWPGTESYNQCLNLPLMQKDDLIALEDAHGTLYTHRVVETLTLNPDDTWVTEPAEGKDMVSLQTCIEATDDLYTLGPNWSARFVVRAERTKEGQGSGFGKLMEHSGSVAAYAGLLHVPPSYYYRSRVLGAAKRAAVVVGSVEHRVFRTAAPKLLKGYPLIPPVIKGSVLAPPPLASVELPAGEGVLRSGRHV